ncbi:MAG: tetratricopeptide repeat protein, partial [Thermoanaerobaculia bacterium]
MTEAFSEERLWQLAERWRREPTSRIFVQLAEEYRRGGRHREALGVLEQGLVHHPDYVSALVVLGRCRLDAGDAPGAVVAFEHALAQDPAQLVANKLLVEAYLRSAQPAKAKERLAFYRLVNDRDSEIEDLERRIAAASRTRVPLAPTAPEPPQPSAPVPTEPAARELPGSPPPREAASAPIFDLGPAPGAGAAPALELAVPSH